MTSVTTSEARVTAAPGLRPRAGHRTRLGRRLRSLRLAGPVAAEPRLVPGRSGRRPDRGRVPGPAGALRAAAAPHRTAHRPPVRADGGVRRGRRGGRPTLLLQRGAVPLHRGGVAAGIPGAGAADRLPLGRPASSAGDHRAGRGGSVDRRPDLCARSARRRHPQPDRRRVRAGRSGLPGRVLRARRGQGRRLGAPAAADHRRYRGGRAGDRRRWFDRLAADDRRTSVRPSSAASRSAGGCPCCC